MLLNVPMGFTFFGVDQEISNRKKTVVLHCIYFILDLILKHELIFICKNVFQTIKNVAQLFIPCTFLLSLADLAHRVFSLAMSVKKLAFITKI